MKRLSFLLIFCALWAMASAQQSNGYDVRYFKEHLLCQKGDETNVIDVDFEWPDIVDYQNVEPLRAFIAKHLLRSDKTTLPDAYADFLSHYGRKVTEKFDTLPPDNKFCYVKCRLQLMGYLPGKFISFHLQGTSEPASASSQPAWRVDTLITYSLPDAQVLTIYDLAKVDLVNSYKYKGWHFDLYLDAVTYVQMNVVSGCLLSPELVYLRTVQDEYDGSVTYYDVRVDYSYIKSHISKRARNLMRGKRRSLAIQSVPADVLRPLGSYTFDASSATDAANHYADSLRTYISSQAVKIIPQLPSSGEHSMVVSVIIDRNGFVQEPHVLKGISPEVDRSVVELLRMMPRLQPYSVDGQPHDVKITQNLKLIKP